MKTVTAEEAGKSLKRWKVWASKQKLSTVGMSLWEENIRKSKTYHAAQKNWYQAGVFPCCHLNEERDSLLDYQNNLKPGAVLYKCKEEIITIIESTINEVTQNTIR